MSKPKPQTVRSSKRLGRLFNAKNIVVMSQHTVDHYSLSLRTQLIALVSVITIVSAASYSTGRYVHAQKTIHEQDVMLESAEEEKQRISSQYELLRNDLLKLTQNKESLADYTQFMIDQYEQGKPDAADAFARPELEGSASKLLERVDFLEQRLETEQSKHHQFIHSVRELTSHRIKLIEKAYDMTGMEEELTSLTNTAMKKRLAETNMFTDINLSKGGPYYPEQDQPVAEDIAGESVLHDVSYLVSMLDMLEALPLERPMRNARFTSGFGQRVDPIRRRPAMHTGIDYAGPLRGKVLATAPGTIVHAGYKGAYGRTVDIDHGNGFVTRYSHLSRVLVSEGDDVTPGTAIGHQGNSGRSTGHHLHYEVRYRGRPINPARFIKAGDHVSEKLN